MAFLCCLEKRTLFFKFKPVQCLGYIFWWNLIKCWWIEPKNVYMWAMKTAVTSCLVHFLDNYNLLDELITKIFKLWYSIGFPELTNLKTKYCITNHFRKILVAHVGVKSLNVIYKVSWNIIIIPWKIWNKKWEI